jgi:ADP-ribose pyrophosphatase YjhB (NUDIX family)
MPLLLAHHHRDTEGVGSATPMISRAVNCAYRLVLRVAYPILDHLERTFGIRSNVAMVAVWHGDRLLMVRHSYRHGDALPGGMVGAGESPAEAAARELHEEVGVCVRPDELIFVRSWRQLRTHTWLFEYRPSAAPRITPDQREVVSARFVGADSIPRSMRWMLAKRRRW